MQRLIDRMLQLARLEAGTEQNRTPHLMSGLLDKVMQSRHTVLQPLPRSARIRAARATQGAPDQKTINLQDHTTCRTSSPL